MEEEVEERERGEENGEKKGEGKVTEARRGGMRMRMKRECEGDVRLSAGRWPESRGPREICPLQEQEV